MAGLYDVADWTELSESSPRAAAVDTLQIHHSTTTSRAAARSLYAAGGRQVSPNCQLHDGVLYGICDPRTRRAFTSGAPAADHRSLTVEVDNITLAPEWGIGTPNHERLAQLFADMYIAGLVGGLFYGMGGIIGHYDVPGSYATACPGPSMIFTWIIARARQIVSTPEQKANDMDIIRLTSKDNSYTKAIYTDYRFKELVTDYARISSAVYAKGGFDSVVDQSNWDVLMKLPNFPTSTGGGGTIDLSEIVVAVGEGFKALPETIVTRLRTFWSTGK